MPTSSSSAPESTPGPTTTNPQLLPLPEAILEVFPELRELAHPQEPRADCSRCPMVPPRVETGHRWAFNRETRCCTYHPMLPNYLAGRALSREDAGAERIRERILDPAGVSFWGISEPEGWEQGAMRDYFGHDTRLRCPFWIGGDLSCGIWQDRTGVCRTWFCKHEHGNQSRTGWRALMDLLTRIESGVANRLIATGEPPSSQEPAAIESWFRDCSSRAATLAVEDLESVRDALASDLVERWQRLAGETKTPLPPTPVPVVSGGFADGESIAVEGYTPYDGVRGPAELLDLFTQLDGERTWQQALERAGIDADSGAALITELHRVDILVAPQTSSMSRAAAKPMPRVLEAAVQRPIVIGDRVWLRGSSSVASVVAPRAVFEFFAALDGERTWREAAAGLTGIDEELVEALYAMGALVAPSYYRSHS